MAMTAREMIPALGTEVLVTFESVRILAVVADVKHVYGRARLLITPYAGIGEQWVELSRVVLPTPGQVKMAVSPVGLSCSNSLTSAR